MNLTDQPLAPTDKCKIFIFNKISISFIENKNKILYDKVFVFSFT